MTLYRPPDYLGTARDLRARRLGTSPVPVHPKDDSKGRATDPSDSTVKITRKYALITTPNQVAELMTHLGAARRVALDLKTTGLDPRRDRIRLLTLTTEQGSWLVDCFEVDPCPLFPILTEKELVVHDALLYLGFLFQMGFEPGENGRVLDTMLMSQLLKGQHPKAKEDE